MLSKPTEVAKQLFDDRYPNARVLFLAGSIVRGEGTPFSDLDLVVIFDQLPAAYRESFHFQDFAIEAFVHDPETLNYFFFEVDGPSGIPSLAQMILEGIEIPQSNDLSRSLKQLATSVMQLGPPALSEEQVCKMRYNITNLVDDIRKPRSKVELVAAGTELYAELADFYFRTNSFWSAKGKSIPRILKQVDAELCSRYCNSFEDLFVHGQPESVITLAEEILSRTGGFLFDGHTLCAPESWRKPSA